MPTLHTMDLIVYVAQHGGIRAAAEAIPYGIEAPGISKQIKQAERELGYPVFEHRPFRMTAEGAAYVRRIRPLIVKLRTAATDIGARKRPFGVGSTELVLKDYVSKIVALMQEADSTARFDLPVGLQRELQQALLDGKIDIAITGLNGPLLRGIAVESVLRLEPVPLVRTDKADAHLKSADDFWQNKAWRTKLVCPPKTEAAARVFSAGLKARKITWVPTTTANSIAAVPRYVAAGLGPGVCFNFPGLLKENKLRVLPLPHFPPAEYGVLWKNAAGRPEKSLEIIFQCAEQYFPGQVLTGNSG